MAHPSDSHILEVKVEIEVFRAFGSDRVNFFPILCLRESEDIECFIRYLEHPTDR